MIVIEVEGDPGRRIEQAINALFDRQAMQAYGEAVIAETRDRARGEYDPDGRPWTPLSPPYARRKKGPGILNETGEMLGTLQVQASQGEALVGTELMRGVYHQQQSGPSAGPLPQRQWLGITNDDLREIGSLASRIWEAEFA